MRTMFAAAFGLLVLGGPACGDDDPGSNGSGMDAGPDATLGNADTSTLSLCDKYGGPSAVDMVIRKKVIEEQIATDCRISPFFTTLTPAALGHVADCLSIQAQGLFGCKNASGAAITYAGSKDSKGVVCRDMKSSHVGLGISKGDFDALIDDVAKGLTAAGVSSADIGAAAPALVGMQNDIVEKPGVMTPTKPDLSKPQCAADAGAGTKSLCDKYGGTSAIDTVIRKKVIEEQIATDCRISPFFTTLTPAALGHVADCLSIQAQGLFGCTNTSGAAITYAGSKDSKGVVCRDMKSSHVGLGISKGDFDALIDDVAKGLTAAGVSSADIGAAAPVLVGMQNDIVERPSVTTPTKADTSKPACASDAGRPDGG